MGAIAYLSLPILLALIGVAAIASVAVYRLYFHPLSKVPGPKLAAVSRLYDFYYDCILGGKFAFKIQELHNIYGPIVRIGPNEVHIKDPDFFDEFYNVTSRVDKDPWYYAFVGSQDAGFGTANVDLHRMRRKAMSRFFATSAISNLESSSRQKVAKLCQRLEEMRKGGKPVNLSNAFRCLAADSVTDYCMPRGFDLLDSIDFAEDYNRQARTISYIAVWHRHIPIIIPLFMRMPKWLVDMTATEGGRKTFEFQADLARQAEEAVRAEKRSDKSVLDGIVNSDAIPESDKTVDRLTQEARTLVGAGSETTGISLETIVWNVLTHPEVLRRLKEELKQVQTSERAQGLETPLDDYATIRKLPYLTAVINEGLRLSNSVSGRLPRVDRKHAWTYRAHTHTGSTDEKKDKSETKQDKDTTDHDRVYVLPANTVISMTIRDNHTAEHVYPDPLSFKPDRWLVEDAELKRLEKAFTPFGRGGRSCIGKELALMNLYLTIANFFARFDADLFQTSERDLEMEHDFFSPFPKLESKGLRVLLKKED
ncbi:Cytochrome P450 monooxygenase [Exophiala dermatitidis]